MIDSDPTPSERIEQHREQAGASGDELARAVDRHRDELGMPAEPADGEDVANDDVGTAPDTAGEADRR